MLNKASLKSICIYATSPLMWDWYSFVAKMMVQLYFVLNIWPQLGNSHTKNKTPPCIYYYCNTLFHCPVKRFHNSRQDNQDSREQRARFVWFLMMEKCAGGRISSVSRALDLRGEGHRFNSQGQTNTQGLK